MISKLIKYLTLKIKSIYISLNNQEYIKIQTKKRVTKITIEDPGIVTIDNIWE